MGDGYPVYPPISFPVGATDIVIAQDGTVQYHSAGGGPDKLTAGQIQVALFMAPERLAFQEPNIYLETDASGPVILTHAGEFGTGQIISGFLEASNVNVSAERLRLRFLLDWREAIADALRATAPTTRP
jgi:flagellar basal body rod protein FlgG